METKYGLREFYKNLKGDSLSQALRYDLMKTKERGYVADSAKAVLVSTSAGIAMYVGLSTLDALLKPETIIQTISDLDPKKIGIVLGSTVIPQLYFNLIEK